MSSAPTNAIMLLEPSSPFATPAHFKEAIALFADKRADLVVGMREMEPHSTYVAARPADGSIAAIVEKMNKVSGLRRQDRAMEWTMNGSLYLFGWSAFQGERQDLWRAGRNVSACSWTAGIPSKSRAPPDLAFAAFAVEQGYIDMSPWGLPRHPRRKDAP